MNYKCIKCNVENNMTNMIPIWDLYEPKYPPNFICKSCRPERSKREDLKKRCKSCSNLYEVNLSEHVCDECYPKCVSTEPINAFPRCGALNPMET